MSTWIASVVIGTGEPQRYSLSRHAPTHLDLPILRRCTVGAIVTDPDGTERVRVAFTFADEVDVYEVVQPPWEPRREPLRMQIPETEFEPLVTILVGPIEDPDGGSRIALRAAA